MLNPEDVKAGIALRPLRYNLTLRGAMEAHLARRRADLFATWARSISPEDEKKYTKDYCHGALDVIDGLLGDFDAIIGLAEETKKAEVEEDPEDLNALLGRGDPAL